MNKTKKVDYYIYSFISLFYRLGVKMQGEFWLYTWNIRDKYGKKLL